MDDEAEEVTLAADVLQLEQNLIMRKTMNHGNQFQVWVHECPWAQACVKIHIQV